MKDSTFELEIEKLIYGGHGLGRHGGKVVFVPFSVPGDRLLVKVVEEKKTFARASILKVLQPASGRIQPPCRYFGKCGGCQWQQLEYARQADAKRQILEELFHHRFPTTRDLPIGMKACTHDYGYRSRARLQARGCGSAAKVGFFRYQSHEVEDIRTCPLLRPALNAALNSVRRSREADDSDCQPCQIEIACDEEAGTWEASKATGDSDSENSGDAPHPPIFRRLIGGYEYGISPATFFQANDFMLAELMGTVMGMADTAANRAALDLFCGVGLFTLPLAGRFEQVMGIDSSPLACDLAVSNAAAARLQNVSIRCERVFEWLRNSGGGAAARFDMVVLDPPRAGAGSDVMQTIRELAPEAVIYVSCDPQTLVRDLVSITPGEYRIDYVQGLDLFPQTYHFETVVGLRRG
jgi:23S rRNA (uracil1939-C5)-methyltransferase